MRRLGAIRNGAWPGIAAILLGLMVAFLFLGCGGSSHESKPGPKPEPEPFEWPLPQGDTLLGFQTTGPVTQSVSGHRQGFQPRMAGYTVFNNTYGIQATGGNGTGESVVFSELLRGREVIGWAWDVASFDYGVVSYPEIGWGWSPWLQDWHSGPTPIWRIRDGRRYRTDFNIRRTGRGGMWNTGFDIWLFPVQNPTGGPERMLPGIELMILLDAEAFGPWQPEQLATVMGLEGRDWTAWKNHTYDWTLIAYLNQGPPLVDARGFDLSAFIEDAVARFGIPVDNYLISVEFGTEAYRGRGMVEIANYQISINEK